MLAGALSLLGWIMLAAIGLMVFDLALALLTNPFDVGLFVGCFAAVAVAHTSLIILRRRRRP